MMRLEQAVQRCFDRCNLAADAESLDVWGMMMRYKAIRELPAGQQEEIYDEITAGLFGRRW